eukprot:2049269-Pleurochrysis_carterae.AAC.1
MEKWAILARERTYASAFAQAHAHAHGRCAALSLLPAACRVVAVQRRCTRASASEQQGEGLVYGIEAEVAAREGAVRFSAAASCIRKCSQSAASPTATAGPLASVRAPPTHNFTTPGCWLIGGTFAEASSHCYVGRIWTLGLLSLNY